MEAQSLCRENKVDLEAEGAVYIDVSGEKRRVGGSSGEIGRGRDNWILQLMRWHHIHIQRIWLR